MHIRTCVKFASKIAAVSYQMCKNLGQLPQINPETYSSGSGISLVHKIRLSKTFRAISNYALR